MGSRISYSFEEVSSKNSCLPEKCKSVAAELAALSKDALRIAACWKDVKV